eukprot:354682-Chlamydomonas_euryale.AAC.9
MACANVMIRGQTHHHCPAMGCQVCNMEQACPGVGNGDKSFSYTSPLQQSSVMTAPDIHINSTTWPSCHA